MYSFGISAYFTPAAAATAAAGGMLLGATVIVKMLLIGQVLGVSGSTRKLLKQPSFTNVAFPLGLVLAGALMAQIYGSLEPLPPQPATSPVSLRLRLVIGGFLVGLGTAFGNGCTSGHGLTGLARLSRRSWAAVPTFMASGLVAATLLQTGSVFPPDRAAEQEVPAWSTAALTSAGIVATLVLCAALCRSLLQGLSKEAAEKARPAVELATGFAFGCGLVISGMAKPSKVAGFLDVGSGHWDLSLAFVMGGALLLTFPAYQLMERWGIETCAVGVCFELPSKTGLDRSLMLGSACFGMGWGVCGACPGPAWVLVGARPGLEVLLLMGGIMLGLGVWVMAQSAPSKGAPEDKEAKALLHGSPEAKEGRGAAP